jgi:hypothetical protein
VNGMSARDFLWNCLALMHFMRLSFMKAAYAAVSSAAYRKSGIIAPFRFVVSIKKRTAEMV